MREAIGGTWMFIIVIAFVMLFTGYLCLAINYSRAYNVKNEIVDIIERENGYTLEEGGSKDQIDEYLEDIGYKTVGQCDEGMVGGSNPYLVGNSQNNYIYCYKSFEVVGAEDQLKTVYYQVQVFFQIDLPVFRNAFTFSIKGDSKQLYLGKEE